MTLFSFLSSDPYENRVVARDGIDGLTVSTAYTNDEGYETAIIDSEETYPVERYEDRGSAILGHAKWCKDIVSKETVDRLGWLGIDDLAATFTLNR